MKIKILLLLSLMISCKPNAKLKNNKMDIDLEKLKLILNIQKLPLECKYEIVTINSFFNEQKIIAALRYEKDDIDNIIKQSLKHTEKTTFIDKEIIRAWLPKKISQCFIPKGDENYTLNIDTYSIEIFSKNNFNNGFFFVIDEWVFIYCYSV